MTLHLPDPDFASSLTRENPWENILPARSRIRMLPQIQAAAPALLPHALADGAGDARRLGGRRHDACWRHASGDFEHQLRAHRVLEFLAFLDRHHEGARAADHAVLVINIEVLDIDRARLRLLEHDGKAVDRDAVGNHRFAGGDDERTLVVGAVAGDVDDAADAAVRAAFEQAHAETQRARNRGRMAG